MLLFSFFDIKLILQACASCSVVSNSLQPHGLYSPWNSPGQVTGVSSLPLLQGIFPTQGLNPGLRSPTLKADSLPAEPQSKPKNPGVDSLSLLEQIFLTEESMGSPTLQADSLPTELLRNPILHPKPRERDTATESFNAMSLKYSDFF